jgi:hypothetical protein
MTKVDNTAEKDLGGAADQDSDFLELADPFRRELLAPPSSRAGRASGSR